MAENENVNEQEDHNEPLRQAREAQKRADTRARTEAAARAAAEAERDDLRAQIRNDSLSGILSKIGAPEGIVRVYPANAEVTEEAVSRFVTEELGVSLQPKREDWSAYERTQRETAVPQAEPDPNEALAKANEDALRKMIDWYAPTSEMGNTVEALKTANRLQDELDQKIYAKQAEALVDPNGYGGRFDPPAWAQTAKAFRGRG